MPAQTFLPAGWPYNQTGNALGAATNPWIQQAQWYEAFQQTPYGQQMVANEEAYRAAAQRIAEQEYEQRAQAIKIQARQMALSEGNAKAQQWLAREQLKLSQEARNDQRLQWQQQFAETQRQNDRQFGLSALTLAQNTQRNPFKFIDVLEGLGPNSPLAQSSGFLSRMLTGSYQPVRGGGTGHPTLEGLASQIDGTAPGGASNVPSAAEMATRRDNDLAMIDRVSANPANYAHIYRRLSPDQQTYVNQGVDYQGGSEEGFLAQMRRGAFANRARI